MAERKLSAGRNFILGALRGLLRNAHKYKATQLQILLAVIDRLAYIDDLYTVALLPPADPRIHTPVNQEVAKEIEDSVEAQLKTLKAEFLGGKNANAQDSNKTNG
jgi:hypothetical protein